MNESEFKLEASVAPPPLKLRLIGVGGGGVNAVDRLRAEQLSGLDVIAINTDQRALQACGVQEKLLIGANLTRGLGAGGDPELGRQAGDADRERIAAAVKDSDVVFLVSGLGGGTGSGVSPLVAELAAETGALVIAFVTIPFSFEGGRRLKQAEDALRVLRPWCDAVIPLPNDVLLQEAAEQETMLASFARADAWIGRGVRAVWGILANTGIINLDFTALRQTFRARGGKTLFGFGEGQGETAVAGAMESLRLCPLLQTAELSRKADRLLVNLTGGADLTLPRVNEVMTAIAEQFGRDCHISMGTVVDPAMTGRLQVTVIGSCEVGGRALPPRRSAAGRTSKAEAAPEAGPVRTEGVPTTASVDDKGKPKAKAGAFGKPADKAEPPADQNEFGFGEVESRGHFEKTDRNLFDGQDLDVPTYLRKGIKVVI
jgi:cell division protein FtsZ